MLNGELETVAEAIADLADNRLPYLVAVRLHNAAQAVELAMAARARLKGALVTPYLQDGEKVIKADDPRHPEIAAKLDQLWEDQATVDLGPPLDLGTLNGVAENIQVSATSLRTLRIIGLWPGGVPDAAAPVPDAQ